jgi:ABC-2 type transport system ATP-binding protein
MNHGGIVATRLTKRFGAVTTLDEVSFVTRPGVVTGVFGPNGAGKTTTFKTALGLYRPTSGTVTVAGRRYGELRQPIRTVGSLLETQRAAPGRRARDHLRAMAAGSGIPARRVDEVLGLVGLDEVADYRVGTYSQGMRQRLGMAAALLGDPPILILDEPTNGLDPEGIRWIGCLLRDLAAQGRTVVASSHVLAEAAKFVDHVLVLGGGRLLADAPLTEFVGDGSLEDAYFAVTDPVTRYRGIAGSSAAGTSSAGLGGAA